ncbi:MAG: hypothetical protein PHO79_08525 [Desulfoplanes sp.]|nr:hypothetical protein [Desulfoplanes sp.]
MSAAGFRIDKRCAPDHPLLATVGGPEYWGLGCPRVNYGKVDISVMGVQRQSLSTGKDGL